VHRRRTRCWPLCWKHGIASVKIGLQVIELRVDLISESDLVELFFDRAMEAFADAVRVRTVCLRARVLDVVTRTVLSIFDEMREIEIGEDEVVLHFDNTGDHVIRTVHIGAEHPADPPPSRHGHSVGRWEGDTLVLDMVGFEPNPSGLGLIVPSSPGKHTVERLILTEDRTRLLYQVTVEDPVYLSEPAMLMQQWDHRPDLEFSPPSQACDDEVAERYIED